jgi:phage-related protein
VAARLEAVFYRTDEGFEPVDSFIAALPASHQVALDNQIARTELLSVKHPQLPRPHSSQVDEELYALHCRCGRSRYRIVYRRSLTVLVLLHAFCEQPGRPDRAEVELARARWEDLRARMRASRPSRPISGPAPSR